MLFFSRMLQRDHANWRTAFAIYIELCIMAYDMKTLPMLPPKK